MILDSRGKLFGKVSIIDLLVIIVVVGLAAGVFYKFSKSDTASVFNKPDTIESVIFIEEAPEYTAAALKTGDLVKEVVQNSVFGAVTSVKVNDSISYAVNDQGVWVQSPKPGYISLEINLKGEGIYGSNGITFGSSAFFVGKFYEIKVGNAAFYGRIKSVRKTE
jgi:hypothetical protein